ncbi:relaxase domain-containing protein [Streptomyces sp. NPDC059597]|uniref:relaxase domain-containing protein n=1 Tax=Streptomyces sp. NPDC059597 TaxID=3346879 RepID=UPI003699E457
MDDEHRRVLALCRNIAGDTLPAWLEDSVAQIRWGSGGKHRKPVKDGLTVAVFRHCDSRAGEPLLHDHALVSVRARRPDGTQGGSVGGLGAGAHRRGRHPLHPPLRGGGVRPARLGVGAV